MADPAEVAATIPELKDHPGIKGAVAEEQIIQAANAGTDYAYVGPTGVTGPIGPTGPARTGATGPTGSSVTGPSGPAAA
jgi:hypothetical protein